ncbi:D-alanine--poly(phosphoribitol) ligase subunit DltA [Latilactobacillus sakei]|uniref:D-alanine--poly(phosphoribitol) ligase subunit DltA n=1 Tax=Latilactobacillus sakei TaxID=1599 RepID=UPI00054FC2D0|nr:D-alanine--poly(phosphoribitol) ligase subunit DltA [Latilactobacillus sakei]
MTNSIIQKIDTIAIEQPQTVAYQYGQTQYSYADLKVASDRIAAFIQDQALPKGAPVIVFGGQQFEMVATFLGAVKAGHAYIPVEQHSDAERIQQIESVAKPAAVLSWAPASQINVEIPVFQAETLADVVVNGATEYDAQQSVQGDDNFYIIFTSGTTGLPKGVQISESNLLSFVDWANPAFGVADNSRVLIQAPYSFDLSVMNLYPGLCSGATLVILEKEITDNFKTLFEVLPTLKVNEWVSTPSFVEICLLAPTFDSEHYPELREFVFCGEELTHQTAEKLLERFPSAKVFNTYGPTEATVAMTSIEITADILAQYDRLPIGYTKADTKTVVVDEQNNEVAPGQPGELLISGPSVSKGYLNNPEKTNAAFFEKDGQRFYHSGDLVVADDNQLIFYKGRTDFQVKMHGYRIELEEIDHHLGQLAQVKQACTVPRYNKAHQVTQLITYVVPAEGQVGDATLTKTLKAALAENTMAYMIPQRFVYPESLPLSVNGKVDRKALIKEVNGNA